MIQRVCICSKQHILKTLKTNILWGTNSGHMGIVFGGTLQMTGNYHKGVSSAALLRMVRSTSNKFFTTQCGNEVCRDQMSVMF